MTAISMRFRTLEEWLRWQEGLHPHSIDLGLERVSAVATDLGLARFNCPVVTVGGTNGKGSCVALLEAMLVAGDYRVGTFTSPHLVRYNERIKIRGRLATDDELIDAFARIDAARGDRSLTFSSSMRWPHCCCFSVKRSMPCCSKSASAGVWMPSTS